MKLTLNKRLFEDNISGKLSHDYEQEQGKTVVETPGESQARGHMGQLLEHRS